MPNPYAIGRQTPQYPNSPEESADMLAGQAEFAVPGSTETAPYVYPSGFSPTLKSGPDSVPDDARLQQRPLEQSYPDPGKPPTQGYYVSEDADKAARHSVEHVQATPQNFPLTNGPGYPDPAAGFNRFAPNPRATPPRPSRVTNLLAPITYAFSRPFMHGTAKNIKPHLNGEHFSMADHKLGVAYAQEQLSMGMIPPRKPGGGTRNTFRLDPTPWDTGYTDMPPTNQGTVLMEAPPTTEVTYQSRTWRL